LAGILEGSAVDSLFFANFSYLSPSQKIASSLNHPSMQTLIHPANNITVATNMPNNTADDSTSASSPVAPSLDLDALNLQTILCSAAVWNKPVLCPLQEEIIRCSFDPASPDAIITVF
jgi:hypothetical protein